MKILINGEAKEFPNGTLLEDVVEQLSLGGRKIAVELNRAVIRRSDWEKVTLSDNDRIEIVHFVGGG
jgi:sulfur carrier protein